MKIKISALVLVVILLCMQYSCQTDEIINQSNIATWTKDLPAQNKDLYQIRLAFGKTLAAALKEEELRNFIKTYSILPGEKVYQELVYALIKDEKLPSGRTVAQVIKSYEDAEIKELFGETLLDRLAQDDPMVAIKLPDIFYETDWDTKAMIPFVGVETPTSLILDQYAFFYYNGYHELIGNFESSFYKNIKYFYIMVKYASDHALINVNNMANEKNIPFEEFFPQLELCKENILQDILKTGVRDRISPSKLYLNIRKCYDIWYELCSYKGAFLADTEPCFETTLCPRDCVSENPLAKNVVLTGFHVNTDLMLFQIGSTFAETIIFSFLYVKSRPADEIIRVAVPVRMMELSNGNVDVRLKKVELATGHSKFDTYVVDLIYERLSSKTKQWIDVNALLSNEIEKGDIAYFCYNMIYYKDFVIPGTLQTRMDCASTNDTQLPMNARYIIGSESFAMGWCRFPVVSELNLGIGIKF